MPASKEKGDELYLESSRHVTKMTSALFYGNGLIVSALPLWLYWRVQMMDPITYAVLFLAVTILSTWFVAYAYKNVKISLKHKISLKREAAVTREVLNGLNESAAGKKLNKSDKDERVLWKKNEVADGEATTFSIFYNNTLYLLVVLLSFYFWRALHPGVNYILSVAGAGIVLAFLSTGA
ncbi:hypothetical protein EMCRGX_G016187 [Ephydatia muelleri]